MKLCLIVSFITMALGVDGVWLMGTACGIKEIATCSQSLWLVPEASLILGPCADFPRLMSPTNEPRSSP